MASQNKQILLVGNPNVGKSTIFNILCNKKQKTGNYAGVTVASHSGNYIYQDENVEVIDLPGSYSIYPNSEDEAIFAKYLVDENKKYQGVVYILEAVNIKRGLLLLQQIQDLGIPVLVVVNQIDEAKKRGITLFPEKLEQELGVKVLLTNAKNHIGIEEIRTAIFENKFQKSEQPSFEIPKEHQPLIEKISEQSKQENPYLAWSLLAGEQSHTLLQSFDAQLVKEHKWVPKRLQTQETIRRYQTIDQILKSVIEKQPDKKKLFTEKLDKILVHPIFGYLIFGLILLLIFEMVFFIASYPMDWIDAFFGTLASYAQTHLPEGPINSLISNGIIPGVGGIVIFAPQIGILLYFLYLLEDSGYMARVVFLMDRFLRPFGLNGKSIVPLVSGTACAIPAVMSTRNIENIKERLLTILVTPFMTCSARLPVYTIIIALIIPEKTIYGISYQALALLAMYLLGFFTAILASLALKSVIKSKETSYLVMDMPSYKKPLFGYDLKLALQKVWGFITGAGKIIFVVSIIIWALSYFGPAQHEKEMVSTNVELDHSYLGRMGRQMEPLIAPLGYDWKMGVGLITSFAAREVFVGTLSTLYAMDEDASEGRILDKMRHDIKPNGEKVFTFATGLSILIFYAFAMQCISTIAVVYRETQSWKWTALQTIGMSSLAYVASMIVFQLFK